MFKIWFHAYKCVLTAPLYPPPSSMKFSVIHVMIMSNDTYCRNAEEIFVTRKNVNINVVYRNTKCQHFALN